MSADLRPRLCVLVKENDGYGFHLHGERNTAGQYIRLVEPGSPAELSGLRAGDRLMFVNQERVDGASHQHVVSQIRAVRDRLELIVVDPETADLLRKHNLTCRREFVTDGIPIPTDDTDNTADTETHNTAGTDADNTGEENDGTGAAASPGPSPVPGTNGAVSVATQGLNYQDSKAELRPRLCLMKKGATGYGFNLHSEKSRQGQYIRAVDKDSPAHKSGLQPRDKVVQVNGVSVLGMQHSDVVATIKAGGDELRMLVVDPETEALFNRCQVEPAEEHLTGPLLTTPASTAAEEKVKEPVATPSPSPSSSSSTASIPAEITTSTLSEEKPEEGSPSDKVGAALELNLSLQQAKERAHQKRSNKRAPPMDWSKRSEVFSNL